MSEAKFIFESQIVVHPLSDGSGYALFNKKSATTAFLKSLKDPLEPVSLLSIPNPSFSQSELNHELGLSNQDSEELLSWLAKTNFIKHEKT